MGTPLFAVPSLKMLINEGYEITGVITQPDRKRGRKGDIIVSPVKELAVEFGFKVIQPFDIKSDEVYREISGLSPDIFITAAYGGIISDKMLKLPRFGCINVHGSLLPKYRGPAPIQWAIINGDTETGVTTMLTNRGIDAGDILLSDRITVTADMYYPEVHDQLAELGAGTLKRTIPLWAEGKITPIPQDVSLATKATKLSKEDGRINLDKSAGDVINLVRGLNPWPGTFVVADGKIMKILKAHVADIEFPDVKTGSIIEITKENLMLKCGRGVISITVLQFENGRVMDIKECWHNLKIDHIEWGDGQNGC